MQVGGNHNILAGLDANRADACEGWKGCNQREKQIDGTEIPVVLAVGIFQIDSEMARLRPVFAENPFSPDDEFVFTGLVARLCHFDVTTGALRAPAG